MYQHRNLQDQCIFFLVSTLSHLRCQNDEGHPNENVKQHGAFVFLVVMMPSLHCWSFSPSDSVTTMVKNLMAPLVSLNQLQLNWNKMEDLVTMTDFSLTRILKGGRGGPAEATKGNEHVNRGPQPSLTYRRHALT